MRLSFCGTAGFIGETDSAHNNGEYWRAGHRPALITQCDPSPD